MDDTARRLRRDAQVTSSARPRHPGRRPLTAAMVGFGMDSSVVATVPRVEQRAIDVQSCSSIRRAWFDVAAGAECSPRARITRSRIVVLRGTVRRRTRSGHSFESAFSCRDDERDCPISPSTSKRTRVWLSPDPRGARRSGAVTAAGGCGLSASWREGSASPLSSLPFRFLQG